MVWNAPILLMFLYVCSVFSHSLTISFTRYELLDIRQHTPDNFFSVFCLFRCFVGHFGRRASGPCQTHGTVLVCWLSSVNAASKLRSQALISRISDPFLTKRMNYFSSPGKTRTFQTLLHCEAIMDNVIHFPGYQLFRADRIFYINEGWCSDVTTLKKMCSSNLEALFINCKPFYSPREFSSFILMNVYVPPDVCVSAAMQKLAKQISEREQKYPDSLLIIIGDFNKANLSRELPKYRQHITCPTRHSIILNHCYTIIKDAYHSVPQAALGLSDQCLVHLIPTYRQKLKSAKPVIRTVKRWTNEAEQDLKACFDLTDWSVFEAAAIDPDEHTDTVSDCIHISVSVSQVVTFIYIMLLTIQIVTKQLHNIKIGKKCVNNVKWQDLALNFQLKAFHYWI